MDTLVEMIIALGIMVGWAVIELSVRRIDPAETELIPQRRKTDGRES